MDAQPSIQTLHFRSDGIIELTYTEPHEQEEQIAIIRIVMFDEQQGGPELADTGEQLLDLLDAVLVRLRKPPATRPAGRRTT